MANWAKQFRNNCSCMLLFLAFDSYTIHTDSGTDYERVQLIMHYSYCMLSCNDIMQIRHTCVQPCSEDHLCRK